MTNRKITNELTSTRQKKMHLTIGMLTADISHKNDYSMWQGVVDAASKRDVNVICFPGLHLHSPEGFDAQANAIFELVSAEKLDGLVIMAGAIAQLVGLEEKSAFLKRFYPLPIVTLESDVAGIPDIYVDFFQNMRKAILHLIQVHNYRRIAFIRGPERHHGANERYRAYVETLAECGLPFEPTLVTPPSKWDGRWGVTWLLDQQVDFEAVVAVNDDAAMGAIEVLQGRGISVPEEVAVVGFDDVDQSRWITAPLTTVPLETYTSGQQALEMVLALIEGKQVPEQVIIPTELVIRQSCGCIDPIVTQAVVEPVTALPKDAAEQMSLETVLSDRQEDILAAIKQAVKEEILKAGPDQMRQLLAAFAAEQSNPSNSVFLRTLDQILSQTIAIGGEIEAWHQVVSVLRRQISPYLHNRETLLRAENLWQQARVLIAKAAQRMQGYQEVQAERRMNVLREVGAALITTFDSEALMNVLAYQLPRLDIRSAYLSLYEDPKQPAGQARLSLAYNEQGRIEIEDESRIFPAPQLIPQKLWPREQAYSMVALPLYFQKDQLGFVVFEANSQDGPMYIALRGQISSALKGALLVEQEEKRARQLQTVFDEQQQAKLLLGKRVRELNCLNEIGREIAETPPVAELLQWVTERIPLAMQYPELCVTAIEYEGQVYGRSEAIELPYQIVHALRASVEVVGRVYISYTEKHDFLDEESALLGGIASRVSGYIENQRLLNQVQQRAVELEEATNFLDTIIENIPVGIFIKDAQDLKYLRVNRAHANLSGLNQVDVVGTSVYDYFPKEQADFFTAKDRETLASGELVDIPEQPMQTINQGLRWLHTQKVPIYSADGAPKYLLGMSLDITERKRAEQTIVQQKEFLSKIINILPVGLFAKDVQNDYRFSIWNAKMEEMFGAKAEEMLGKTDYDYSEKERADFYRKMDLAAIESGQTIDIPVEEITTIWGLRLAHTVKLPIYDNEGKPETLLVVLEDVTEQKRAEAELREREELFRALFENSPDAIFLLDPVSRTFVDCNETACRMNGYSREELIGQPVYLLDAVDRYGDNESFPELADDTGVYKFETLHRRKDGTVFPIEVSIAAITLQGRKLLLGIDRDITERKQAEEKLGQANLVVENSPVVLFRWKAVEGWPVDYVSANVAQFGYTAGEFLNGAISYGTIVYPDDWERLEREAQEYTASGVNQFQQEYRIVTRQGQVRWVDNRSVVERDANGKVTHYQGTIIDITERKQAAAEHERLLAEVEVAYRQYIRREWEQFLGEQQGNWRIEHQQGVPQPTSRVQYLTSDEKLAEMQDEVIREGKTRVMVGASGNGHPVEPAIVAPIALRGQVIGTLSLQDIAPERKWTDEEMALVQTVSEQLALTVENLRLIDETSRQAAREKIIADMTRQVWASGEMERVMETAAQQLGITLDASKVVIRLGTEEQLAKEADHHQ